MGGPWERYAETAALAAGPWTKYAPPPAIATDPLYSQELDKAKSGFNDVRVPAPEGIGAPASPEQAAAEGVAHQRSQEAEQAAYDATRTPGKRAGDTAAFVASMPVRMATKGEYGAGDVAGLVSKDVSNALNKAEGDFVGANTGKSALETFDPRDIPTLATMQHVGEIAPSIPELGSMGAVRGQVLRQGAMEAQQLKNSVNPLLRGTEGSGPVPGGGGIYGQSSGPNIAKGPFVQPGSAGGTPPPGQPPAPPAGGTPRPPGIPDRPESFATRDRIAGNLGVNVDLPEMIVGSKADQSLAAGMKGIPHVGTPIERADEKFLGQMGQVRQAAASTIGVPVGAEAAGGAVKQGALDWIRKNSKDYLKEKYDAVYATVKPEVTRDLTATRATAVQLIKEMQESSGTAAAPAVKMVEDAITRRGLNTKGLAQLRSEIGAKIDAAKVVPDASEAAYKRLYPALTTDLRATLKAAGGDESLRAWDVANREAKIVAGKRKRIAQVIGSDEDKLSDEAVFKRLQAISSESTSNLKNLRQMREIIGEKDWGNVGAEMVNRMGVEPKAGLFSADRFLTAYGKMSDSGKNLVFGGAKPHLDDMAALVRKYGEFSSGFNRSNTGKVNAILKFARVITNPVAMTGNVASAFANPLAAATIGGHVASVLTLRAKAWSLAKPANAEHVSRLLKAYDRLIQAADGPAGAVARHEQTFAAAARTYAQGVAAQTGQNADELAAAVQQAGAAKNTIPHDDIEAAIVRMVQGPERRFSIPELRKVFPDASEADFRAALDEMAQRGVIELPKK